MSKRGAWVVLSVGAASALALAIKRYRDDGGAALLQGLAMLGLVAILAFVGLAVWARLADIGGKVWGALRAPPWRRPRVVIDSDDQVFGQLMARLDPLEAGDELKEGRVGLYRDRETGQHWQKTTMNMGHGHVTELRPVRAPE